MFYLLCKIEEFEVTMELASPSSMMRTLELDKICRACLTVKKDMKPLFGEGAELVSEMLMECARVQIDNTDGWPDKICIQCVHQVSRCHAFKLRVEKSDQQLRQYIKGITVIVEEPLPKEVAITQIELPPEMKHLHRSEIMAAQNDHHHHHHHQHMQRQEIQIQKSDGTTQQMIISNGQLHNTTAQLINGQILTTSHGQPILQAGQIIHQGQLVQTGNNVQLIQANGQAAQVVQIQRTGDGDRCEIIVQPDLTGEAQYFEDVTTLQDHQDIEEEHQPQTIEVQEEDLEDGGVTFTLAVSDAESETEDKQYLDSFISAEFITLQTSCPSPGRFVCNLCHKEFKHSKWLRSHMKSHSNWIKANCKKQPQCQICHRSFKGPGMLKMHMKTHEQKQHNCDICPKKFSSNHMLQNHLARHRGEKSHKCSHCDKSFYTATDLKNHMQHHLGLKGVQSKKSSSTSANA